MSRGMLVAMATILTIVLVPIVSAIALDYGDHLMHNREMQRMLQESRESQDRTMLEICKTYRQFQKTPAGRDTTSMDEICSDLETRYK